MQAPPPLFLSFPRLLTNLVLQASSSSFITTLFPSLFICILQKKARAQSHCTFFLLQVSNSAPAWPARTNTFSHSDILICLQSLTSPAFFFLYISIHSEHFFLKKTIFSSTLLFFGQATFFVLPLLHERQLLFSQSRNRLFLLPDTEQCKKSQAKKTINLAPSSSSLFWVLRKEIYIFLFFFPRKSPRNYSNLGPNNLNTSNYYFIFHLKFPFFLSSSHAPSSLHIFIVPPGVRHLLFPQTH